MDEGLRDQLRREVARIVAQMHDLLAEGLRELEAARHAEARATLARCYRRALRLDDARVAATAKLYLATAALRAGDTDEAEADGAAAVERYRDLGDAVGEAEARALLIRVAAAERRPLAIAAHVDELTALRARGDDERAAIERLVATLVAERVIAAP